MDKDFFDEFKKVPLKGQKGALVAIIVLVVVVLIISFNPFVQVGAGERGVVLKFGAVENLVLDEGLHFIIPFMERVIKMNVQIQKDLTEGAASSKDLQEVSATVALNYHIQPDKAHLIYQDIGVYFKERVIDPAIQEILKAVTARYTAEELITKRPEVSEAMKLGLKERLTKHNILIDDLSIVNFSFSKIFMEAIESKQTAEQLALKASRDLDRIKIEAEQKLTTARAEAEALRLQKQNLSEDLIKLRQVEATITAINKWNGILPTVTSGAMPFIDVKSLGK
ncbi:MAG: prohibitin family protein [Nitrospirae bacterium]|nr:prohibitin family protein [Nitrospirota bacterium]